MKPGDLFHKSKYSIFSLLTDGTRIHHDDICLRRIDHFAKTRRPEDHIDLLRIRVVHLATEGFYVIGFENHFCQIVWKMVNFTNLKEAVWKMILTKNI